MTRGAHVVLNLKTSAFECQHCARSYAMAMPVPIDLLVAASKAFFRTHRSCKKPGARPLRRRDGGTPENEMERKWAREDLTDVRHRAKEWLAGDDTGQSSKTLWGFFMGLKCSTESVPFDGGDFGRCYRLLKKIPEWRARLAEVAVAMPEWAALIREWSKLEALYERDLESGGGPELHRKMRVLIAESEDAGG